MPVSVKRVYESAARGDGTRVLVDRLWPRGLSKQRAELDAWLRNLAPSDELRKWYHARPEQWLNFRKKYLRELTHPGAEIELLELYRLTHGKNRRVTLLFASKNQEHNNAMVLKELLDGMRKPPSGTGPGGVRALQKRQAAVRRR